jgi:hypothetical protein
VGSRTGLDDVEKRKIFPYRDSDLPLSHPAHSWVVAYVILIKKIIKIKVHTA